MARLKRRRKPVSDINVVPYIDVMLVLLIIFMVTAPLLNLGVDVDLPQASAEPLQNDDEPIVVSVTRDGDYIILNMPSNITFATDSASVNSAFHPTLNSVALVLERYNRTLVDVYGHTDSTGDDNYNLKLSEDRALAVASYLNGQGVDPRRFSIIGYGERQPIASNATPDGRAANRRVEIRLAPIT